MTGIIDQEPFLILVILFQYAGASGAVFLILFQHIRDNIQEPVPDAPQILFALSFYNPLPAAAQIQTKLAAQIQTELPYDYLPVFLVFVPSVRIPVPDISHWCLLSFCNLVNTIIIL